MWKSHISNKTLAIILGLTLSSLVIKSCIAMGGIVYDPANFAKNALTAAQTAEMLANETKMLNMQITSMQHLGTFNYRDIAKIMQKIEDITQRGQALSYSMRDIDAQFAKHYPNYNKQANVGGFKDAYTTWDETSLQTFQNTLAAVGVTSQDTKNEHALLEKLKGQSSGQQGQTRLLQISHELAINTNQHLMTLKEIIAAQTNAQTVYMSQKVSKQTYEEKSMDEIVENAANYVPPSGQGYGKMQFVTGRPH